MEPSNLTELRQLVLASAARATTEITKSLGYYPHGDAEKLCQELEAFISEAIHHQHEKKAR